MQKTLWRPGDLLGATKHLRVGNTTYLYYDAKAPNLTCELRDSRGKAVPATAALYDGPVPEVGWLALPHDSILKFRVTLPGFGQATNLVSAGWRAWRLPPGETGIITCPAS